MSKLYVYLIAVLVASAMLLGGGEPVGNNIPEVITEVDYLIVYEYVPRIIRDVQVQKEAPEYNYVPYNYMRLIQMGASMDEQANQPFSLGRLQPVFHYGCEEELILDYNADIVVYEGCQDDGPAPWHITYKSDEDDTNVPPVEPTVEEPTNTKPNNTPVEKAPKKGCNRGGGNGAEGCDPGKSAGKGHQFEKEQNHDPSGHTTGEKVNGKGKGKNK